MSIKSGLKKVFNRITFGAALTALGYFGMIDAGLKASDSILVDTAKAFEEKLANNVRPSLAQAKAFQEREDDKEATAGGLVLFAVGLGLVFSGISKEKQAAVVKRVFS